MEGQSYPQEIISISLKRYRTNMLRIYIRNHNCPHAIPRNARFKASTSLYNVSETKFILHFVMLFLIRPRLFARTHNHLHNTSRILEYYICCMYTTLQTKSNELFILNPPYNFLEWQNESVGSPRARTLTIITSKYESQAITLCQRCYRST